MHGATSIDQLDTMLREGRITVEEYATLRTAMEAAPSPPLAAPAGISQHRRLEKSFVHRQLGGVCYGLAKYLGISSWAMRLIVLLVILFSQGIGLLVYLIFYFVMPWAEEPAAEEVPTGYSWRIAVQILFYVGVYNLLYLRWMGPMTDMYPQLAETLPGVARVVLRAGSFLFGTSPGYVMQAFLAMALVAGANLPRTRNGRVTYSVAVSLGLTMVLVLMVICSYLAFFNLPRILGRD